MAFVDVIIETGLKLLIALFFIGINTPILRLIVDKIYNLQDRTFSTASAVIIWVTLIYFVSSFLLFIPFFKGISVIATMGFFIFLIKRSYNLEWGKTLLVWMVWFGSFVIQGMIIVSVLSLFI